MQFAEAPMKFQYLALLAQVFPDFARWFLHFLDTACWSQIFQKSAILPFRIVSGCVYEYLKFLFDAKQSWIVVNNIFFIPKQLSILSGLIKIAEYVWFVTINILKIDKWLKF